MKTNEKILDLLKIEDKLSLKQIAEKLNVNQSTVSMAAKKLESENKITLNRIRIEKSFVTFASLNLTAEPKSEIELQDQRPEKFEENEGPPEPAESSEPPESKPVKSRKEVSRKLDLNEILKMMEKMDPKEYPAYRNTLKQLHDFKKKIFIEEMVNFLNAEIL